MSYSGRHQRGHDAAEAAPSEFRALPTFMRLSAIAVVGVIGVVFTSAALANASVPQAIVRPADVVSPSPTDTPSPTQTPSPTDTPSPTPSGLSLTADKLTVVGAVAGGMNRAVTVRVLANDHDSNGGTLSVVSVTQPKFGTAKIVNNAVVVKTTRGWNTSVLTYTVSSTSGAAGKSKLTIVVTPPPHRVHLTLVEKNQVRGIGTMLTVRFSAPVKNRAAAQAHMFVTSTRSYGYGAWAWRDAYTAQFRPHDFWPGHSKITVRADLSNVVLGTAPDHRPYIGLTTVASFRTSRAVRVLINARTDRAIVKVDNKVVRNMGVSLGKTGFTTRSGIKVTAEKYLKREMTAQGIGITNPYDQFDVVAPYAVRITNSGEFIHGAPWAIGRIGRWNGSHGCTNLTPWDAAWFYNMEIPGDVVITTGTNRTMEYWNGEGGPWNIPWKQWLAMSAGPVQRWTA